MFDCFILGGILHFCGLLFAGVKLLFRFSLSILSVLAPSLLGAQRADIPQILEEKCAELHDSDALLEVTNNLHITGKLAYQFPIVKSHLLEILKVVRDRNLPDFTGLSNILDRESVSHVHRLPYLRSGPACGDFCQDDRSSNYQKGSSPQAKTVWTKHKLTRQDLIWIQSSRNVGQLRRWYL